MQFDEAAFLTDFCFLHSLSLSVAHRGHQAVVQVLISKQDGVFDEDGTGSQDEG